MSVVLVNGAFDNLRSPHFRLLQEAARRGPVRVLLWDDATVARLTGQPPKFPLAERAYFLRGVKFVHELAVVEDLAAPDRLPPAALTGAGCWAYDAAEHTPARAAFCGQAGLEPLPLSAADLAGFPDPPSGPRRADGKKVIVTGCYDWLHSGHVRFFEEVAALGELYVAVGNDANVRHLKGAGHPLQSQDERRYMAGCIRHVTEALITTGWGWLDAEPEIERLRPAVYAVNEDGDKPEKQAYCAAHGIEYAVLRRVPAPGLPARSSTRLRGF